MERDDELGLPTGFNNNSKFIYVLIYLWLSRLFTENDRVTVQVLPVTCYARTEGTGGNDTDRSTHSPNLGARWNGGSKPCSGRFTPRGTQPRYGLWRTLVGNKGIEKRK